MDVTRGKGEEEPSGGEEQEENEENPSGGEEQEEHEPFAWRRFSFLHLPRLFLLTRKLNFEKNFLESKISVNLTLLSYLQMNILSEKEPFNRQYRD